MHTTIKAFDKQSYSRISQLMNKSNQFNLTTKRYSQADIERIAEDNKCITLYGQLKDKFGDNGIVALAIGRIEENVCAILIYGLWSCRVLKRGMKNAMIDAFIQVCRKQNIEKLLGYYIPTQKNHMIRDFYDKMGFTLMERKAEGDSVWLLDMKDSYAEKNKYITMKED